MKKLFTLSLLALLATGCAVQQMTPAEFENVKGRISAASTIVTSRLAQEWDQAKRTKALEVTGEIRQLVMVNDLSQLDVTNVLNGLASRFSDKLGLDEQAQRDVRDAILLIEVLVGPVKLGLEGGLAPQDQELVLAFLDGLELGLE